MIRSYQDALDFLYSFIDPQRRAAATAEEAERNPIRVAALLDALGTPQAGMRTVVIAGTKGKGSTAAMIAAIAQAAGLRVGLWTSPHLNSYRERIQINRIPISQADLVALTEAARPQIEAFDSERYGSPSTFDIGFSLALRYFAAHRVDLAVIEVGLGGRYDAANVLTPLVSVISSISYDHMAILGHTLRDIAWNKAGIMKPGVPCVSAPQQPEAGEMLIHEATTLNTALWFAQEEALEQWFAAALRPYPVAPQRARLRGAFQQENARLAIGTTLLLRDQGMAINETAIGRGLAQAEWPGRFELISGAPQILIDGAHNADSAGKLAAAIQQELRYHRLILVLGTSRDKDIRGMAEALLSLADSVVLTRSGHPRAMDIDRVASAVAPYLRSSLTINPNVAAAIESARALAGPEDVIVITGSLFMAGAARAVLGLAVSD
ncbi:MAG: bifunctional folylpolyglutamate synthase/dihydrofolate synthase [Oscillochloris sp.]|nr:bifunctional folylpolyglutamate synthase/dihydrofolate synthase [Oscillochloris sp.]